MMRDPATGELRQIQNRAPRQFLSEIYELPPEDQRETLRILYEKPVWVIALVRERLEQERPYEAELVEDDGTEEVEVGG